VVLSKTRSDSTLKAVASKTFKPDAVLPGAFVFCERASGAIRFSVAAAPEGSLPVEQAASLLAVHCLVRGQAPCDYTVLVVPVGSLLGPVGERAQQLLETGRAIGSEVRLSPREREVLECVLRNLSNKEIGARLNVSERTIKYHVSALLAKFKVRDRVSLMREVTSGLRSFIQQSTPMLFGLPDKEQETLTAPKPGLAPGDGRVLRMPGNALLG